MLFLDTSVIVAFYIPEAQSGRVQRLFSSETPLAICSLTEVEFTSAVARLVRMKAFEKQFGRRVLEEFRNHIQQKLYAFRPVARKEYDLAQDWIGSFRTSLRTLDALQLAVASSNDLPFVTADKGLTKSAKALGVTIRGL